MPQTEACSKCGASLEAIRAVFAGALAPGKLMLLPDLSLIPRYEEMKHILGL